jgi:MSHA biogenesis protein MshN
MSVINKMLRDLDARRASATGVSRESGTRVLQGTAGLPGLQAANPPMRALRWLVGLLVLMAASATAWYLYAGGKLSADRPQPVAAVVAPPAPVPAPEVSQPIVTATTMVQTDGAPAALPVPAPPVTAPAPPLAARPPLAPSKPQPAAAPAAFRQPPAPAPRGEPGTPPAAGKSLRIENARLASRPTAEAAAIAAAKPQRMPPDRAAAVPTPAVESTPARSSIPPTPQHQRQAAAQETLANAQGLWASGSREAALDLMREAVAVAERAHHAGTLAADSPVLPSLVRELVRMELAEGRVLRVLDMLTRLEPALSEQADLWAVRGNAAQRLARHQESVHAYLKALELRPDEPRWMLGAAVSLAALGRLEAAAEQVEKARAVGTVSPEILTYLRQAGVPLK